MRAYIHVKHIVWSYKQNTVVSNHDQNEHHADHDDDGLKHVRPNHSPETSLQQSENDDCREDVEITAQEHSWKRQ